MRTSNLLVIGILFVFTGCFGPLKPGRSSFKSPSGVEGSVVQSQNPKQETTQKYERITEPAKGSAQVKVTERVETTIGAAQKDTGREIAAKLSSLKGVVWVGILLFIFGAASLVYPPLKLIVGSSTTSAVAIVAGIALMALPSLIVGNEMLIMGVGVGAVVLYFFAHRHGHLRGELSTLLKEKE